MVSSATRLTSAARLVSTSSRSPVSRSQGARAGRAGRLPGPAPAPALVTVSTLALSPAIRPEDCEKEDLFHLRALPSILGEDGVPFLLSDLLFIRSLAELLLDPAAPIISSSWVFTSWAEAFRVS